MKNKTFIVICFLFSYSCFAQSNKGISMFDMKYVVGMTEYHAFMALLPDNSTGLDGLMRVKFFHPEIRQTVIVEQELKVENTTRGTRIASYSPHFIRDDGSRVFIKGAYSPDNFYIRYNSYGGVKVTNIDNQGTEADVTVKVVEQNSPYLLAAYLVVFKWECLLDNTCDYSR